MNSPPSIRSTILFVGFVIVLSAVLWLIILTKIGDGQKTPRTEMLLELSKVLSQLVLVTVLGATVTFLYNQYAKEQEQYKHQLQEDNKLRRESLDSLIAVRAQIEKTRREFRLLPANKKKVGYHRAIQKILEARLRLSQVWHDTETWKGLYPDRNREIETGLTGMKVFLDNLVDEYEAKSGDIQEANDEASLRAIANLPFFGIFVVGDGGPAYTKEFLEQHYRSVARIIRQHILI